MTKPATTPKPATPSKLKLYLPIAILVIGITWLFLSSSLDKPEYTLQPTVKMPWQIETHSDGTSTVFDITLEKTTVDELRALLGHDHELAIISDREDNSGLEVYYGYFSTGPITGKLIARVKADMETLWAMQERAAKSEYLDTGSRKFTLNAADLESIRQWPIVSLSLVPSANLDEPLVLSVFGQNAERIQIQEGTEHFLYPEKGLEVIVNEKGKEVLQYVAPRSFSRLADPLKNTVPVDGETVIKDAVSDESNR